ncbi:Hypothetical protein YALI2_A00207g [Yarrowia lipolytica]|jgi:hypothetical protein|nr:Hypothetical protein YALI2_A00207g [Yarrowia lipolytica]
MEFNSSRVVEISPSPVANFHSSRLLDNSHRFEHLITNRRLDKIEKALEKVKAHLVKPKVREVVVMANLELSYREFQLILNRS